MIRELFAEEIGARAQPYWRKSDFLNDVRDFVFNVSSDGVRGAIDPHAVIRIGDFVDIFDRISSLPRYQLSMFDKQDFVAPLWDSLMQSIRQGYVRCWCDPHLDVLKHGRIATEDLMVFLDRYDVPDDGKSVEVYHTDVVQIHMDACRTASAVVDFQRVVNYRRLMDMQMPLLLAAGFAPPVDQDEGEARYAGSPVSSHSAKIYRGCRHD